jgi:hypothetical protein
MIHTEIHTKIRAFEEKLRSWNQNRNTHTPTAAETKNRGRQSSLTEKERQQVPCLRDQETETSKHHTPPENKSQLTGRAADQGNEESRWT